MSKSLVQNLLLSIFNFAAIDDLRRHQRDKEVNGQKYRRLLKDSPFFEVVPSSKLIVGDMVIN